MSVTDSPFARATQSALRDTLRGLDRRTRRPAPARPTALPTTDSGALGAQGAPSEPTAAVRIGSWVLTEDPATGDLLAVHDDGTTGVILPKGQ